ncbi:MAG TPA: hypothetical protein VNO51_00645 [Ilumatobacteraceae bacterium]|nr:hypothetical protein [Ilumatobacteraceae bacterium]
MTLHRTILDPASGRTAVPPAVRPLAPVSTDPFELLRVLGTERHPSPPDDSELGRRRQRRLLERCAGPLCTGDRPA